MIRHSQRYHVLSVVDSVCAAQDAGEILDGKRRGIPVFSSVEDAGYRTRLVGTSQTSWMRGARYCVLLESLNNVSAAGEIEHGVWSCWNDSHPEVIVIEGQGSLMNPASLGGLEILAAARPDILLLQHAPGRNDYLGFPGHRIDSLRQQIQAVEAISARSVVAITISHEGIPSESIRRVCSDICRDVGRPVLDVLLEGADNLAELVASHLAKQDSPRP